LAGELKAKREAEDRRQSGLAAQRMAREAEAKHRETSNAVAKEMNQKHRSTLLKKGINPSTGLIFNDYDMAEMERKANTPERRRLFEQIQAGHAGTLNEQPPVGGVSDYVDPLDNDMTVKGFRDKMDAFLAGVFPSLVTQRPELTPEFLTAEEAVKELGWSDSDDQRFPARFAAMRDIVKTKKDDPKTASDYTKRGPEQ